MGFEILKKGTNVLFQKSIQLLKKIVQKIVRGRKLQNNYMRKYIFSLDKTNLH